MILSVPLVVTLALIGAPDAAPDHGATTHGTVLTLDAVLARAWNEAPSVATASANARVARARVDVANAPTLPSLAGVVGLSGTARNDNAYAGRVVGIRGPQADADLSAGLHARWLLLDFGRTGENVRSARLSANAADADVDGARTNATLQAGAAFLALAGDAQLVEARKKIVDERQRLFDVAHGRVVSGVASPIEETRARVALETAKVDVLTSDAAQKNDAAALAIALGIDPGEELHIAQPDSLAVDDDPARAADLAEQSRAELVSAKLRVDASEASLLAARAGHLPSLAATANALGTGYFSGAAGISEQGDVGAELTIPIFDAAIGAQVAAAESELVVAKAGLREQTLALRGAASQAAVAVRSASASLSAAESLGQQADENYRQAAGRYELGAAGLLELTDAETQQSAALLSLIGARYQLEDAKLRLKAAIGSLGSGASKR